MFVFESEEQSIKLARNITIIVWQSPLTKQWNTTIENSDVETNFRFKTREEAQVRAQKVIKNMVTQGDWGNVEKISTEQGKAAILHFKTGCEAVIARADDVYLIYTLVGATSKKKATTIMRNLVSSAINY